MPLFTAKELGDFIREPVDDAAAIQVEKVAWGWLTGPLGLTERPTAVGAQLYAWALELGAIALENPSGLSSYQLGAEQRAYSAERRAEILAEVEAVTQRAAGGVAAGSPIGSFPEPLAWPDPIRGW